jgi:hypothetical protein
MVNSLHIFLPPSEFSSSILFQRRHVITNHTNNAELPALWLSADRNCELRQSVSRLKEGIWCSLRRIKHFCGSNSNSNSGPHLRWWISNLETSEYFGSYSLNTTQVIFMNPGLTNASESQCGKFTVHHTAICRRGNRLTPWIKDIWISYLLKVTEHFRHGNLY